MLVGFAHRNPRDPPGHTGTIPRHRIMGLGLCGLSTLGMFFAGPGAEVIDQKMARIIHKDGLIEFRWLDVICLPAKCYESLRLVCPPSSASVEGLNKTQPSPGSE